MHKLVLNSLRFYWRNHFGVLLGTMLAAAVLTGSLLVGDSVDGSLRKVALHRLGGIHYAMQTSSRFFAAGLAERISNEAAALLQLRGMAIKEERQINRIQVMGCDSRFWRFVPMDFDLLENEVALNRKLAAGLGAEVGDEVSLRIEKPGMLPRDAPLASQKDDRSVRGRFKVVRILSDNELGRFGLSANQVAPYNAFVNFQWLEERVEMKGKANLLVTGEPDPTVPLAKAWTASDFGLSFQHEGGIFQLESDGIYLDPEAARAAASVPGALGTLTYLVNSISKGTNSTPYSFLVAHAGADLGEDEIIINRWLADVLHAAEGDSVAVAYYELMPSNRFEVRERRFIVRHIAEMADMELERRLAPAFPGLSDVDRCADWDAGIPMEEKQLEDAANEAYWNRYRQTPKAIVSLKAGQSMWSNRFGNLTGVRWFNETGVEEAFLESFDPAAAGYVFLPVRTQALASVDNAMDFGELFVGMSFFLIVAALILTGLLFVFGIQQRAEEMGVLLAAGWRPGQVRNAVLIEGGIIALAGSLAGAWLGIGYTKFLIAGLARYWSGAIANSSIAYFGSIETVFTGAVASLVCALVAMAIAVWRQAKHPARELLMADFSEEIQMSDGLATGQASRLRYVAAACGLGAVGIAAYALVADVHSVTMPFFGAGALLLVSGVLACGEVLKGMGRQRCLSHIGALAARNVTRRRGRSLTVVGMLACGTFLIFAVSSMKEDVAAHADEPGSGTGGFKWFGESTLPIRDDLGGVRLRVRDGDDASCLNLNRARAPRLLGVDPDAMSLRKAFMANENVWERLKLDLPDGIVPALVGDADTAMWGLEAKTGVEKGAVLDYIDEAGNPFKVKLVGNLPMRLSVFQGTLLIAEQKFTERFPGEEGYRMFLLDGTGRPPAARKYERAGLDVVPSVDRLMEFYSVESTYLAMFLVLGALGLAVGSMGMGVVVLRNVQDRRAETALLHAVGYRAAHLRTLLFIEHGLLMLAGLAVGIISAAVAMIPALFITRSQISYAFLASLLVLVAVCGAICMSAAIGLATRGNALRGLRNE